jgi:SNF2 family DNA or RNA helicase
MPINKLLCPTCRKPAITISHSTIAGLSTKTYECGHIDIQKKISRSSFENFVSLDGKRPYPFQIDGAVFETEIANGRFLNNDEMGIGKTVQGLMPAWAHPREMTKLLVLCKAGLKAQWSKEITRWCGEDWFAQIISGENDYLIPGSKGYILSFDTLWRFKDIPAWIKRAKVKYIILDEVQHLKNTDSKRTNGVRAACKEVPYIGALSGTPIVNHAGEYFVILNILRPDVFRTKAQFDQIYVDTYFNGYSLKYGGLKNLGRFEQATKDFIIRRRRIDVLPDLPTITRDYRFSELGGQVEQAYKDTLKEFQDFFNYSDASATEKNTCIIAYLTKMRHITGIAKVEPCCDFVKDFIENTDRKIVIFAHHKDVRALLWENLEYLRKENSGVWGSGILTLPEDPDSRPMTIEAFAMLQYRVLIASTQASGEGSNLQFCSDCIVAEHQWTSTSEDQAEGRFIRIGQKESKVTATYLVAVGTIDEFLVNLKERKRSVVAQAIDKVEYEYTEVSIMKELAEVIASQGGKRWGW